MQTMASATCIIGVFMMLSANVIAEPIWRIRNCEAHSDCQRGGTVAQYCALYQNNRECWPCIFCTRFDDAVDGKCSEACPPPEIIGVDGTPDLGKWNGTEPIVDPEDGLTTASSEVDATSTTTFAPITCPKSCTSCKIDEVTADIVCDSCVPSKLLLAGKCVAKIFCKAREVLFGGALDGNSCACVDDNCQYCVRESSGDVCKKCRNGRYLLDGACVKTCPSSMAMSGIASVGRQCRVPFTCRGNKQLGKDGFKCKCATESNTGGSNCHQCEHEAGGHGQKCTRCSDGKYLFDHVCHDNCTRVAATPTDLVAYSPGVYGSECRSAFMCSALKDTMGNNCKCPKSVGFKSCHTCLITNPESKCLRCTNQRYLHNGVCVTKCPSNTLALGTTKEGRVCV
eukprot:m.30603 g.30603  ORF g.30603 m.30603 type:complete len:397 (-) comp16315_c0_seq1:415-1605(-)